MTRRELLDFLAELWRLCLRTMLYASIAAVVIFVGILALGHFLSRW